MNRFGKWFGIGVAAVIGSTLLGFSQLGGVVALGGALVAILLLATGAGRVSTKKGSRSARSAPFLGRYSNVTDGNKLPAALVTAFTVVSGSEVTGLPPTGAIGLAAVAGLLFAVVPTSIDVVFALVGGAAAAATLVGVGSCEPGIDATAIGVGGGVIIIVIVSMVVVSNGLFGLRPPLTGRVKRRDLAFAVAGLIELAAFVGRPFGVSIWDDAPLWARIAAFAFLGTIGLGASHGPRLVLGLVAIALLFAEVAVALSPSIEGSTCGIGPAGLPVAGAFIALWWLTSLVSPSK